MPTIYTQCSATIKGLAREGQPFCELDVVRLARHPRWTDADHDEALRHTPAILCALFRQRSLVRFGPVGTDAPLTGEPDYVRRQGFILYADFEAWRNAAVETPNGIFDAILGGEDPIHKVGRRKASERDDFVSWTEQIPRNGDKHPTLTAMHYEVMQLRQKLEEAHAQLRALQAAPR